MNICYYLEKFYILTKKLRNLSREASAFCVKLQIYKGYLSKRKENMDIDCCECTP